MIGSEHERRASVLLVAAEPLLKCGRKTAHSVVDHPDVLGVRLTEGFVCVSRAVQPEQMEQEYYPVTLQRGALQFDRRPIRRFLFRHVPTQDFNRAIEHPFVQCGVVVGRSEVLELLSVHSLTCVWNVLREERHHRRCANGPSRGRLVQKVIELYRVRLPSLGDGAGILVESGEESNVAGPRLSRWSGVADPPSTTSLGYGVQERRARDASEGSRIFWIGFLELEQSITS